jgi:hypothetical protein
MITIPKNIWTDKEFMTEFDYKVKGNVNNFFFHFLFSVNETISIVEHFRNNIKTEYIYNNHGTLKD